MTDTATELVPVPCKICKHPVVVELPSEETQYRDSLERSARLCAVHNECFDAAEGAQKAALILQRDSARLTSWQTFCPKEFQKPIEWGRQSANRSNLAKLTDWTFGEKGLLVTGGPGRCKTRFLWRLLNREWDLGRKMNAIGHTEFRKTITALAASDSKKMLDWLGALGKVQILFIDDLGKGRATPASEEGLFDLLDLRMKNCLPTLYTSNLDPAQIEANFSQDYGAGIIRRVLDTTKQIEF